MTPTSTPPKGPSHILQPEEQVLSTLNPDGSRRWLKPKLSHGRFLRRRRVVAWILLVLFTGLPFLKIGGKPVLLLDLAHREFTFFGVTFLPTDTLLLALLLLSIFVSVFLATALFGRVWCGWACPQTVYMEFVYRPIERLLKGGPAMQVLRYAVYLVVSLWIANTFLAYFVGVDRLKEWMTQPPSQHPAAFLVMAVVTLLMMIDFCYAREQVCTLMCPYGRFQSVMLDKSSLIIGYDEKRGEPRGPLRKSPVGEERGDCVDCNLCVTTCPTGIDIRQGLQLECIGCAQCIDACDAVMDKIKKPRGLIRYSSQQALAGESRRLIRPRVVIYPLLLAGLLTAFGVALGRRAGVDLTFLRVRATPYEVVDEGVRNRVIVKLTNKTDGPREYRMSLVEPGLLTSSTNPVHVEPGESFTGELTVVLGHDRFERGRADITIQVIDDRGEVESFPHSVVGPLFGPGGAK